MKYALMLFGIAAAIILVSQIVLTTNFDLVKKGAKSEKPYRDYSLGLDEGLMPFTFSDSIAEWICLVRIDTLCASQDSVFMVNDTIFIIIRRDTTRVNYLHF